MARKHPRRSFCVGPCRQRRRPRPRHPDAHPGLLDDAVGCLHRHVILCPRDARQSARLELALAVFASDSLTASSTRRRRCFFHSTGMVLSRRPAGHGAAALSHPAHRPSGSFRCDRHRRWRYACVTDRNRLRVCTTPVSVLAPQHNAQAPCRQSNKQRLVAALAVGTLEESFKLGGSGANRESNEHTVC